MGFSYSKVECFHNCPYCYKLRYLDKLEPKPDMSPNNALFCGTAVHEGIEKRSVDAAVESYKSHYPELTNAHEIEILKLKTIVPTAIKEIPEGEYEKCLRDKDGFIGYIDCLVPVEEGVYDLLDFKHSNNVNGYKNSAQVHLYKYYYEKITGNKIRDLYYVFIPKYKDVLTEDMSVEDEDKLKQNIIDTLSKKDIIFEKVEYNRQQVNWFFARKALMDKAMEFPKRYSVTCNWCDYQKYCSSNGKDTSELVVKEPEQKEVSLFA